MRKGPSLIELKQERHGFNGFFGAWIWTGRLNILVDVGPANGSGALIRSLENMGVDRVDWILLTHIHLDHAGGLSALVRRFPRARVVCHAKAVGHLNDPSRLWAGSQQVLGEIAAMYGEPRPVAAEKLVPHPEASVKHLRIIETPGHAPHHLSFEYHDVLFAGEAGGNFFRVGVQEYMRPATPPVFFMEECLRSVDRLLSLESQTICYAHFGEHPDPQRKLDAFRKQLIRWKEIIREGIDADPSTPPERLVDRLLERDPDLQAFHSMEPAVQERERFFIANSVRGYLGYLQKAG